MSIASLRDGRSPSPSIGGAFEALDEGYTATSGVYSSSSFESPTSEIPLEEVEKALSGLSREDLVLALKRAKEQLDIVSVPLKTEEKRREMLKPLYFLQLDSKMDGYLEEKEMLECRVAELYTQARHDKADLENLQVALQQREDRVDELMREQDRKEDEIYAKQDMIERLRKCLADSEKGRIEAERRYQDQVSLCHLGDSAYDQLIALLLILLDELRRQRATDVCRYGKSATDAKGKSIDCSRAAPRFQPRDGEGKQATANSCLAAAIDVPQIFSLA